MSSEGWEKPKMTIEERSGVFGTPNYEIRRPYTDEDMRRMFWPYLTENVVEGLSPREVRLIETVEHLRRELRSDG